ncbi:MAG TPA: response regulator [Flavisolibacter sp.]|jgi:DNA-binding response OmpR family regulator|nr:response regulator [Flavisolibacter sp.]
MIQQQKIQTIIVIDDDPDDFNLLKEAFGSVDSRIDVIHIASCEAGRNYKGALPDLVFLDLNMPDYDGFHWLNGIREKAEKELPVIVFTTSSNTQHISKAYTLGANLFFTKPNSFGTLLKGIQKILEMDWQKPAHITKRFFNEGKCLPLQVA